MAEGMVEEGGEEKTAGFVLCGSELHNGLDISLEALPALYRGATGTPDTFDVSRVTPTSKDAFCLRMSSLRMP